jgi:chromate transporter
MRPLRDVAAVMLKLGTIAFGGPAVHVAMLREETVRRRHWLRDDEFLDLFGAVSVLPGPSSTQLAIALGRRRAGLWGLALGGALFIAPAMTIVMALAWLYVRYGTTVAGRALIYGVEPVVIAIVAVAIWELARSALKRRWLLVLAAAAVAAYFLRVDVLLILVLAGAAATLVENREQLPGTHAVLPMFVLAAPARPRASLTAIAREFAKLGVVVFGSGYALLAFLRSDLVTGLHWLNIRTVLDAVAAGQITPGPVFTTATFLGYVLHGVPGALVATAAIFVPSFLMVSLLEPVLPRVRRSRWLSAALDGIVVAALGLMSGVTYDLARRAIVDPLTIVLAAVALGVMLRWRPNPAWVVLGGAAAGAVRILF